MATIFIDTSTVKRGYSGTGRYTATLANALHKEYDVQTHQNNWHPGTAAIPVNSVNHHKQINLKLAGNRPDLRADFSFFPNYFIPPQWPYLSAVTIHDVSFLTHPRFYPLKMVQWYRRRIRHTIKNADAILTVSEASKQAIISNLNVNKNRIFVHAPAIPLSLPAPSRDSDSDNYLLYVGTIEPKKGVLELLKGFRSARCKSDTKLVLIGKINSGKRWTARFYKELHATPGAEYRGYVEEDELRRTMASARGLVLLSRIEGFGIPVMDALSNEIPVLISDDKALQEITGGYITGVNPDSVDDIFKGITGLLESPPDEQHAAFSYVQSRYTNSGYTNQLLGIAERMNSTPECVFPVSGQGREVMQNGYSSFENHVVAGICYAAAFRSAISLDKLHISLPVRSTPEAVKDTVRRLAEENPELIMRGNNLCCLKDVQHGNGRAGPVLLNTAEVRGSHSRLIRFLAAIPWMKSIYYSGGTVHGSGFDEAPDLDVLIVSQENRAWLVLALVRLISRISGKGDSFCSNYIVDRQAMDISWQRDYYTAHQLLFLKQIYRSKDTPHIRSVNSWIYDFFPNAPFNKKNIPALRKRSGGLLAGLNYLLLMLKDRKWKRSGFRSGHGGMLWDAHRIKLHTNDHRGKVSRRYNNLFSQTLNNLSRFKEDVLKHG